MLLLKLVAVFGVGSKVGCRDGLCEKRPGAVPISDTAGSSWLLRTHYGAQLSPAAKLVGPL